MIALAILVGAFASLRKRSHARNRPAWLAAWWLIVAHFAAQFFDASGVQPVAQTLSIWALELAGIFFMVGTLDLRKRLAIRLAAAFALPLLAVGLLAAMNVANTAPYVAMLALAVIAPPAACFGEAGRRELRAIAAASLTLAMPLGATLALDRDPTDSLIAVLSWLFFGNAVLTLRRAQHASTGLLTTVVGFVAWGLVFPAARLWPDAHIDATAWNIPKYVVAFGFIVTLLEEQIERSRVLAMHDQLTGLPNRRSFEERLDRALNAARRTAAPFALLTIDLDNFKTINDCFGHHGGDTFLRTVAGRFSAAVRKGDFFARFGGDEFVVVADGIGCRLEAERFVRALASALAEPVAIGDLSVNASASIGVALFPEDGDDLDALLAASDFAMYASKRRRRFAHAQ